MSKPEKRKLKFNHFDEMLADARLLYENGYSRRGNWTLGQATGHVALWMTYPLDGFPVAPIPVRMIMWLMKVTVGQSLKRKIFAEGFKPGMMTAPVSVPDAEKVSDQAGIEQLEEAIRRVTEHQGELNPSPLFGPMDKETLIKVSLLHAEHHFGYLEPN